MSGLTELDVAVARTPGDLLRHRARHDGGSVALAFPRHGTTMTFADWDAQADDLGRALIDLGLARGDRVGLLAENRVEWPVVQVAVARAGLVLVPANTHSRSEDLHHVLAQSGVRCVVLTESFRSGMFLKLVESLRERLPQLEHVVVIGSSHTPVGGHRHFDELVTAGSRSAVALPDVLGDDPAVLIYTSGTTGQPKGAVLSHGAVSTNGRLVFERLGVDATDVVTSIVPMFHSASFCMAVPGCLATGARFVGLDAFDPVEMMRVIETERASVHIAVPTTLRAMLQHPRRGEFDLSSLRVGTCGGADTDPELLAACIAEFPFPGLVQMYGLTEAAAIVTCPPPFAGRDLTTAGTPLPGYEVRIASADTDEVLPSGTTGEVQVRTRLRMTEYFRLPEATEAAFTTDGWLRTGDLGELTAAGELRLTGGRLKDMIIRGGENVYPVEVENTLLRHPRVREAAVFGLPDQGLGEIVAAAVVCDGNPTAAELTAFCTERLARFKAPTVYFEVEAFPLTPNGKIRKTVLRECSLSGMLTPLDGGADVDAQ